MSKSCQKRKVRNTKKLPKAQGIKCQNIAKSAKYELLEIAASPYRGEDDVTYPFMMYSAFSRM
jgi:hypothetical protein